MTLDTATLFIASSALDMVIALFFWTLWIGGRGQRMHLWVAASASAACLGCFLYMLREIAPDWVAVWAAQVCFIQTFAFLWAGIRLVERRRRPAVAVWMGSILWTAACLVPGLFAAEQLRNVVATIGFAGYCIAMSVELLRPGAMRRTPARVLTAGLLLLLTASSAALAIYTSQQSEVTAPLVHAPTLAAAWLLLYMVIYVALILAVTTLELGNEAQRQREAATIDGLTGLTNRRAFMERAGRLARRPEGAAVMMLDIDHFKQINDRHGHAAGDEALRRFAALLREMTAGARTTLVARLGGEEFACLIPAARRADAAQVAERIRAAVAAAMDEPTMTVSIGLAVSPGGLRSIDELLSAADQALYRAKRTGRNRVETELAGDSPHPRRLAPHGIPASEKPVAGRRSARG